MAAQAREPPPARAARTASPPAAARRDVSINLTPFAPRVGDAPIADSRRWLCLWNVTPAQAATTLLGRLERFPNGVRVERSDVGEVLFFGRMAATAPPELQPGSIQPLAIVACGLTAPEAREALAQLASQGWRP